MDDRKYHWGVDAVVSLHDIPIPHQPFIARMQERFPDCMKVGTGILDIIPNIDGVSNYTCFLKPLHARYHLFLCDVLNLQQAWFTH
jgi:hypothetical protein